MNSICQTEGIVLQSFPFQDYDQILTLYSAQYGILKLIVKGARSSKRRLEMACSPLSRVECIYREGKGDIYTCREIRLLDGLLALRQNLELLESACELVNVIQHSQWPGKPSAALYDLLKRFLEYLPQARFPASLSMSFRLKVLKHEGLFPIPSQCTECGSLVSAFHLLGGENFCGYHAPKEALHFEPIETKHLETLTTSRSLKELDIPLLHPHFKTKVEILFSALKQ